MAHKTLSPQSANSELGSLELTEEVIRQHAYRLYAERGGEHGHDVEDWLQAEAEVMGKKPSTVTTMPNKKALSAVAG
jgi:hypothetical protein